jgi:outer membrane protein OmpA-like peptidoglycan-associated protein
MKKALIFLVLMLSLPSISMGQVNEGFEDDFADKSSAWRESENENSFCQVQNGQYIIEHKRRTMSWLFTKSLYLNPDKDFYIESKMTQLSGVDDDGYGIIFGMSGIENYYCFVVSSEGKYKLYGYRNNDFFSPREWTKEREIHKKKTANILGIKKSGNEISFFVNGKLVFSQEYQPFSGLSIGFVLNRKMKVAVDYIKIKQPNTIHMVKKAPVLYKKENLGSNVNSPSGEIGPVITQDGKTLFIDRKNHPENTPGNDNDDIWITHYQNGSWEKVANFGWPLNNNSHNFVLSVSPDENTMLVGNLYNQDGSPVNATGVSVTYRTAGGWSIPEKLEIEDFYSDGIEVSYNLSADRKTLILSVERKDTYGEHDLYVSFLRKDDTWSKPVNMGRVLNTLGDESTPYLAADNVTLYFSTSGKPGFGDNDIFVSKRLDNSWTNWSEPLNLGPEINTRGWDGYYSTPANGEYAYIVSSHQSLGQEDIFRIKLTDELKPEPVVIIYGTVVDKETGKPLEASITYYDLNTGQELGIARTNPADGSYKIILPYGHAYGFHADKTGYYSERSSIDLTQIKTYTEIERNLLLTPMKAGSKIALNNVWFVQSKPELLPASKGELDRLVQILKDNPTMKIDIAGHTDNVGDPKKNQQLSEDRVKTVKNYLINHGISAGRLTGKGYGSSKPIAGNDKEETRKLNRRVEFTIVSM